MDLRGIGTGMLACVSAGFLSLSPADAHDGQHDFDFDLGTFKTHILRLKDPLTSSKTWITMEGTVTVRKVWDGRAQLEELQADGSTGHIEGLTLRLYNPESHQWGTYFASPGGGGFGVPTVGGFHNGRGELFDQEAYNGRVIQVRNLWTDITPDTHKFEQDFSDNGGKTWEPNWVATLTRVRPSPATVAPAGDAQHDFDFNIGAWKTHIRRLQHPLTGSTTWVEYNGTHIVHGIWGGRANIGELEIDGPSGHLEGLSLRLYDPTAHQWSLNFANNKSGALGVARVGQFKHGSGEFIDQEPFNGRTILVRSVWSDITATTCHQEQSFSDDGGKTWEVNWIADDTRISDATDH